MAARPSAAAGSGGDGALDQSIHRLLGEINQRRKQAAHFAQLVEQSIYHTPSAGRTSGVRWSPAASDGGFAFSDSIIDDCADERPHSASPPASFLEGFTQNFVDTYQAPSDVASDALAGPPAAGRFDRMVLRAHAQTSVHQPAPCALAVSDWCCGLGRADYRSVASDASRTPEVSQSPGPIPASPQLPVLAPDPPQPPDPDPRHRGATVIDRAARLRMWQRMDPGGEGGRDDEARIQALVRLAEQIAVIQPTAVSSPSPPSVRQDAPCTQQNGGPAASNGEHGAVALPCWAPGEWEQWAARAREHPVGAGRLDSSGMAQRLEWVHEHQPWLHGFGDALVAGGKLKRTYRDLPLDLQAYPDGNVKRTAAAARHPVDGSSCVATTLYFANGDWSCILSAPSGAGTADAAHCYYYYCDEAVWHEQHGGAALYRFPDGREERTDARGTLTVRYPSGDVRVALGR
ncbi:hypothetical protein LPJ61_000829 [Coemansia biformis]|uniref:Uncharacterized protein n=1 Tax=Coemansia biformis TaxID=1286918 RepID=A0A9W7YB29_9FUNG|nr:hypothetical protein LPJ61_000829 [Coemansia biformis]